MSAPAPHPTLTATASRLVAALARAGFAARVQPYRTVASVTSLYVIVSRDDAEVRLDVCSDGADLVTPVHALPPWGAEALRHVGIALVPGALGGYEFVAWGDAEQIALPLTA